MVDDVDVVACVDPIPEARQMYMDDWGIPSSYATLEECAYDAEPDIVSVCTWHLLHDPLTVEAASYPVDQSHHLRKAHGYRYGAGQPNGRSLRRQRH